MKTIKDFCRRDKLKFEALTKNGFIASKLINVNAGNREWQIKTVSKKRVYILFELHSDNDAEIIGALPPGEYTSEILKKGFKYRKHLNDFYKEINENEIIILRNYISYIDVLTCKDNEQPKHIEQVNNITELTTVLNQLKK